jgi:hypothetical protein
MRDAKDEEVSKEEVKVEDHRQGELAHRYTLTFTI